MVELKNVEKSYGDKKVLKGISLSMKEGEIFGLLGPSGAGKTTMIKIITGQAKVSSGEVLIHGTEVGNLCGDDKKQFGIMMDEFGLYDRLSCYDNLKLFADIYGIGKERIYRTLEEVGLKEATRKSAMNLSKGMRQRLSLARVFMIQPKIMFLDEPTSGLDPSTADEIHRLLLQKKEEGCLIFLTTHNMAEAAKLCDYIALLNEGRIVEYGEPDEICRKYNHKKRLQIRLRDGNEKEYEINEQTAEVIGKAIAGDELVSIHSTEPNLESVFMELTGRSFAS